MTAQGLMACSTMLEFDATVSHQALEDSATQDNVVPDRFGELRFVGYPWQRLTKGRGAWIQAPNGLAPRLCHGEMGSVRPCQWPLKRFTFQNSISVYASSSGTEYW